jgi:hypothetical protein
MARRLGNFTAALLLPAQLFRGVAVLHEFVTVYRSEIID